MQIRKGKRQADLYALQIKQAFTEKDIPAFIESFTNQQFVVASPSHSLNELRQQRDINRILYILR